MRRGIGLLAVGILALTPAIAAAQTSGTAEVTFTVVNVGTLEVIGADVACPGVSVGDTTVSAACTTPTWRARDFRGTGEGWHVTVSATDFTSGSDTVDIAAFTVSLAANGFTRTSVGDPCPTGCPASLVTSAQPLSTSGLTIVSAAEGTGLGEFTFTPSFVLTVPAGTPSGSYSSTMTATIVGGPG